MSKGDTMHMVEWIFLFVGGPVLFVGSFYLWFDLIRSYHENRKLFWDFLDITILVTAPAIWALLYFWIPLFRKASLS